MDQRKGTSRSNLEAEMEMERDTLEFRDLQSQNGKMGAIARQIESPSSSPDSESSRLFKLGIELIWVWQRRFIRSTGLYEGPSSTHSASMINSSMATLYCIGTAGYLNTLGITKHKMSKYIATLKVRYWAYYDET